MIKQFVLLLCILLGSIDGRCDELVILSPHWEGIKSEFGREFRRFYRERSGKEVTLRWLDVGGGTSDILKFLRAQYKSSPNGIGVDLFFGGGTEPYLALKKDGLLAPSRLSPTVSSKLQLELNGVILHDKDSYWHSAALSTFGILYNRKIFSLLSLTPPEEWKDLAIPRLGGWISLADPRKSGSAHMVYELLLQNYGWEQGWKLILNLASLTRNFSASAGRTVEDVVLGEAAATFTIDSYGAEAEERAGSEMIGFVVPPRSLLVSGDGIALLKGGPSPAVATLFIEFVLSESGQKLFYLKRGARGGPQEFELRKLSVLPSLYQSTSLSERAVSLNPFAVSSEFSYDQSTSTRRWGLINDLIGHFVIDTHSALQAFQKDSSVPIGDVLGAPISLTEADAALAEFESGESRRRFIRAWREQASARIPKLYRSNTLLEALPVISILTFAILHLLRDRKGRHRKGN